MTINKKLALSSVLVAVLAACGATQSGSDNAQAATEQAQSSLDYATVLNGEHRSDKNKARDAFRNPQQTLAFLGLEKDMTVVELWPGRGWYFEILAPLLKDEGKLYAAHFPSDTNIEYFNKNLPIFKQKVADNSLYSKAEITEFQPGVKHDIAPKGSADMVLTFRNLHNWYMYDENGSFKKSMQAVYDTLKPGGIFGVVDHQLPEDLDQEKEKKSGYIKKSITIDVLKSVGFELVADSSINKNPKDTAQHPSGVWTLPPSLRAPEGEEEKYKAIGESDRFTLKFRKPV